MPVLALSTPEVVRTYTDESQSPRLQVLCLRWGQEGGTERLWELPEGVSILCPAPTRFGVSVQRIAPEAYSVRLVWDHTLLSGRSVSRAQLLTSCLSPLLSALGTDLWHLLDQPAPPAGRFRLRAA